MAFGLAMHLSGVESEYFYEIGARTIYDAGTRLMATTLVNTFTVPRNIRAQGPKRKQFSRHPSPKHIKARPKESRSISPITTDTTTDDEVYPVKLPIRCEPPQTLQEADTVNQLLGIIEESDETDYEVMSESSSSSGVSVPGPRKSSNRNKLLTAIMTKPVKGAVEAYHRRKIHGYPTMNVPPPIYNVPPPGTLGNDWQRPLPYIDVSCPPPLLDTPYNIESQTTPKSQLSPIGTKPSGSPIRKPSPLTVSSPNNNNIDYTALRSSFYSSGLAKPPASMGIFPEPSIWTYEAKEQPSTNNCKVIYQNRDILQLADNIRDPKWQFRPAELPAGNTKMFFENRSQYHRVATSATDFNGENKPDTWDECKSCDFRYPAVH